MIAFLKKFFNEVLKITGSCNIVRAHRVYREGTDQTRLIIVASLNLETKKQILHAAWKMKEIIYKGTRIFFDHDFTFKVKQQRDLYRPMREQLKAKNIKSHILTPAKLKVFSEDGTLQTYGTPQAAAKALEERGVLSGVRDMQEAARQNTQYDDQVTDQLAELVGDQAYRRRRSTREYC